MSKPDYFQDLLPLVTSSRMSAALLVRWQNGTGTCFIAESEKGQCVVTALHVIAGAQAGDEPEIYYDGQWHRLKIVEIVHSTVDEDVSIFTIGFHKKAKRPISLLDLGGWFFGQSLTAIGYPHGIIQHQLAGHPYTIPLCKTGSFAGAMVWKGADFAMMDAYVNPGYSGAPVLGLDYQTNTTR